MRLHWLVLLALIVAVGCSRPPTTLEGRVYVSQKTEKGYRILWLDPRSGEEHVVLEDEDEPLRNPVPHPDGTRLAYLRGASPRVHILNLLAREDDEGRDQQLTSYKESVSQVTWSPDGLRMAYLRYGERQVDLVVHVVSGQQGRAIWTRRNLGVPSWSPRGVQIAFTEIAADGVESVWVVDHTGENAAKVYTGATSPVWASGSEMIVIIQGALHYLPLAGGSTPLLLDKAGARSPSVSPQGGRVAALYDGQLWTMNGDGTAARQLGNLEPPARDASWGKGI